MDVERLLVTKIIREQSLVEALARPIESHHFLQRQQGDANPNPLPGEVYGWMTEHFRRFKSVPSYDLVRMRWPIFELLDTTDTMEVLIHTFVGAIKRRIWIEKLREQAALVDDPTKWADAEVYAFEAAADLARAVPSSNITRLSDSFSRLELHRQSQSMGRAPGITLVAADLDALTYGIQPGEFMVWEGFLGGGKSTQTMIQSATEYAERAKTSLVFALEMMGDKMANRWDAAMSGFKYKALKFMEMRDADYEVWARFAEKVWEARFEKDVLVIDDIHRPTPERIYAEIERWSPDFFIVDTIDEMAAPNYLRSTWERGDYIAKELKAVCRVTKRPGIGVAQSGRDAEEDGATLGNVAQSITINRKADLVVGLHCTPQMKRANQLKLRMLKNRDGEGDGLEYTYFRDPATLTLRPWTPGDAAPPPPRPPGPA